MRKYVPLLPGTKQGGKRGADRPTEGGREQERGNTWECMQLVQFAADGQTRGAYTRHGAAVIRLCVWIAGTA